MATKGDFLVKFFTIKGKKGISPLIATVLMIAFAVALGAVVMNWGRAYVEDTAEEASRTSDTRITCAQNVNVEVVQVGGSPKLCYNEDESRVEISLQNRGSEDLAGFVFNILGSEGSGESAEINESLPKSGIQRYDLDFDTAEHGDIEFVQAVPKIIVSGSDIPAQCSNEERQWEEVLPC